MTSSAGLRRALEAARFGWFPMGLLMGGGAVFLLEEVGVVLAAAFLGLVFALALEMARPIAAPAWRERLLATALYVPLAGPMAIGLSALGWTALTGAELNFELSTPEARDAWIRWAVLPPAIASALAGAFIVARRGTARNLRVYVVASVVTGPAAFVWSQALESDFLNVSGLAVVYLGSLLLFAMAAWRILFPLRHGTRRSLHLYENQAGRTGASVEMAKR